VFFSELNDSKSTAETLILKTSQRVEAKTAYDLMSLLEQGKTIEAIASETGLKSDSVSRLNEAALAAHLEATWLNERGQILDRGTVVAGLNDRYQGYQAYNFYFPGQKITDVVVLVPRSEARTDGVKKILVRRVSQTPKAMLAAQTGKLKKILVLEPVPIERQFLIEHIREAFPGIEILETGDISQAKSWIASQGAKIDVVVTNTYGYGARYRGFQTTRAQSLFGLVDEILARKFAMPVLVNTHSISFTHDGVRAEFGDRVQIFQKDIGSKTLIGALQKINARSEARTETAVANDWLFPRSYVNLNVEGSASNNIFAKFRVAKEVVGNIFEIGVAKLKSFTSVIARAFFPEHFSTSAAMMRGIDVTAARQILPIKVTETGHAIVVTPGVVEMGLLPVLRAVYQSSDIFVVGADKVQERLAQQMEGKMSGLGLKTVVEFVKDASAFQAAVAKRTMQRKVSAMQISGLSTANDLMLAQALKTQVPDLIYVTSAIFQRFQPYTNGFIQGLVTKFQAAISRERSA
jgi:hypothetical protein